jgi:hypothetical protein
MAGCFPSPALPGSGSTGLLQSQNSQPSGSPHKGKTTSNPPQRQASEGICSTLYHLVDDLNTLKSVDFLFTPGFWQKLNAYKSHNILHRNDLQQYCTNTMGVVMWPACRKPLHSNRMTGVDVMRIRVITRFAAMVNTSSAFV